jgi:RNA-binding protein YlmH
MIDHELKSRIDDTIFQAEESPKYLGFYNDIELFEINAYLSEERYANFKSWGGYDRAQRCMICFYPEYCVSDKLVFPIDTIVVSYPRRIELHHRDFLGALMNLGIKRNTIGDILAEDGTGYIFVRHEITSFVMSNLDHVGKASVKMDVNNIADIPIEIHFEEINDVVSSDRADCIVSALLNISRSKSSEMIKDKLVMINNQVCREISDKVPEHSVITIRGNGKFILDEYGRLTKKGRMPIYCKKYL